MVMRDPYNITPPPLDGLRSGPPTNPLQRPGASAVLELLSRHPDLAPDFVQSIVGMLGGNIQQRQDEKQATRQGAFDTAAQGLTGYATSGYATPEGLSALGSSYQAMSPSLNGPNISGRLEDLIGSLGGVAATVPNANAAETTPLDPDTIAGIETDVQAMATGQAKQPNGLPFGLHEAMVHVISKLRASGYSDDAIAAAQQFITQRWQEYGGPERPSGGY